MLLDLEVGVSSRPPQEAATLWCVLRTSEIVERWAESGQEQLLMKGSFQVARKLRIAVKRRGVSRPSGRGRFESNVHWG